MIWLKSAKVWGNVVLSLYPMNAETQRRLHNIATIGTVSQIDTERAMMRLQVGEILTDWLAMPAMFAGRVSVWRTPSVGEQFLLISPSGDLGGAIPVISLYSNHFPAPSDDPDKLVIRFNDTDTLTVHSTDSTLHLHIDRTTLDTDVHITGNLSVDGKIHAKDDITTDADVKARVSLNDHTHGGVQGGRGSTGVPQ